MPIEERSIKDFKYMSFYIQNIVRRRVTPSKYEYSCDIVIINPDIKGILSKKAIYKDDVKIVARNIAEFKTKLKQYLHKLFPYRKSDYPTACYRIL